MTLARKNATLSQTINVSNNAIGDTILIPSGNIVNLSGIFTATSGNFTQNINIASQTASTIASFDANKNIISLSSGTYPSLLELSYVKGANSSIQNQLDGLLTKAGKIIDGSDDSNAMFFDSSADGWYVEDSTNFRSAINFNSSVSGLLPTVANSGDNRVLTSTGSSLGINAESNLTFNGSLLAVSGNLVANTGTINSLNFNNIGDPDLSIRQLAWNNSEGSLAVGLSDTYEMFLGGELHYRVRNNTGSSILAGTAVYATGLTPGGNNRIEIAPKAADGSIREVRFMGLVTENIDNGVNGFTTHFGYIRNIDTRGDYADNGATNKVWASGEPVWAEGDILYIHPTAEGKLTKIEPKHSISVAIILNRHQSEGKLFVRPTSYGHLGDNHDVDVSGATNGQFLQYNSTTDYWVPSSSGNFTSLSVNSTGVSISGHTHTSSNITNFNSSVSGLLPVGTTNYVSKFGTGGSGLSNSLIFDNGTNVGIGTTTPSGRLHVIGSGLFNGDVTANGSLIGGSGTALLPSFEFINDPDTGLFSPATNTFGISTSGIERLRVNSDGNVGIGSGVQATERLVVDGNIRLADTATSIGNRLQLFRGGGTSYDYTFSKEGSHIAISTANDPVTSRFIQFGYHSGTTWNPRTVINGFNGSVGIGTTTPSGQLHVIGTGIFSSGLSVGANTTTVGATTYNSFFNGNICVGSGDVLRTISILGNNSTKSMVLKSHGGNSYVTYGVGSQNLGLGDSDVGGGAFLNINHYAGSTPGSVNGHKFYTKSPGFGGYYDVIINSSGWMGIGSGIIPQAALHVVGTGLFSGDVTASGSFIGGSGTSSLPSFEFVNDPDTGLFSPAENTFSISTSGVERLRVNNIGNVGIGTSTPSEALDVVGNIICRNLYLESVSNASIVNSGLTLNLTASQSFNVNLNSSISGINITNVPSISGVATGFSLIFTADGTPRSLTWPNSIKWAGSTAPTLTSTNGKTDIFSFVTINSGINWFGFIGGQNY
jgi:hypothetical protein